MITRRINVIRMYEPKDNTVKENWDKVYYKIEMVRWFRREKLR